jgi:benzoyl-CoA reductase/2-hydroxyglutaryl-CoA dehydratase subunit BcrC/BadD/HgdB
LELRFQSLVKLVNRFEPDGIIFSSNRSCKPYSLMQMDLQRRVEAELGVPAVMIDCDMADERFHNESQAFLRIEALLERIASKVEEN